MNGSQSRRILERPRGLLARIEQLPQLGESEGEWRVFGSQPSKHDVDIVLKAYSPTYDEIISKLEPQLWHPLDDVPEFGLSIRADEIDFLDRNLVEAAHTIGRQHGLPVDVFMVPFPGDFSIAAWVEPPHDVWDISWRFTGELFFHSVLEPEWWRAL
jgi:hypothetical protein